MISYWKATCSPEIEINPGYLDKSQVNWWKDLILKGMGEFFYKNKINFLKKDFIKFTINSKKKFKVSNEKIKSKILVPLGGGKDSIVTAETLKKSNGDIRILSLNPTKTVLSVIKTAKENDSIFIDRKIDKKLLELNRKGFLNGHTPFSAYLAFLSTFCAILFDRKYIAMSNERSANEPGAKYLGKEINHQYSKSFDFEKKFRNYSKKYLAENVEYFSFLRPLYEIQIAKIFARMPRYFPVFLSCNEAYKTDSKIKKPTHKWCGKCSKCLFVFSILYPFIDKEEIIKIFGKNIFEDKLLLGIMKELIGEKKIKPFECVGTKKESIIAFYLSLKKSKKEEIALPFLIKYFENKILSKYPELEKEEEKILGSWDKNNNLPKDF